MLMDCWANIWALAANQLLAAGAALLLSKAVEPIQVALHKPSLDGRTVWTVERLGAGSPHPLDAMTRTAGSSTLEAAACTVPGPPLRSADLCASKPPHPSKQGGFMQTACWERSLAWFNVWPVLRDGFRLISYCEQTLQRHGIAKGSFSFS